jgi:branched-chain amino acid transport system substrate-binding protein
MDESRFTASCRYMSRTVLRQLHAAAAMFVFGCGDGADSVVIGLAGPFSEPHAQSMQLAAELAVSEINRAGGVRGRMLELAMRDDSGRAAVSGLVARSLYDDPSVVAVIGHLSSAATLTAGPIYNGGANPLPQISPSASSPEISSLGPYTFRVCPTDAVHGSRLADWARHSLGARTAAIVFENDAYGRGLSAAFRESFTLNGGHIVTEDPFTAGIPSFEPYFTRLRVLGGAEVLLIAGTPGSSARILATLDSVGLRPAILGGDGITGVERDGADAEGVFISTHYLADAPAARNEAFVAAYRQAFGESTLDHRGAATYDIVHLLVRAIEAVGTSRSRLRQYLAGVGTRSETFSGVTGQISFSNHGDLINGDVTIAVVRDRRLVATVEQ